MKSLLQLLDQPVSFSTQESTYKVDGDWMKPLFGLTDGGTDSFMAPYHTEQDKLTFLQQFLVTSISYNKSNGQLTFRDPSGDRIYQAGWFMAPTVRNIKTMVTDILRVNPHPIHNIGVVQGKDVGQAHVEAQGPQMFQGASQMNALEMISPNRTPWDGIEQYKYDGTQGPRTALACAPGTFLRNYYHNILPGHQFNALSNLDLSHHNGYLLWGNNPEEVLVKLKDREDEIKIPTMVHTQVAGITIKGGMNQHILNKTVHQIYSSAVPVDIYGNGGNIKVQMAIAEKIILAEYIGMIGMSLVLHQLDVINGKSSLPRARINLTLIGAGVFNVPEDLVIKMIGQAIEYYRDYSFDLMIHGYASYTANRVSKTLGAPIVSFDHQFVLPQPNPLTIINNSSASLNQPVSDDNQATIQPLNQPSIARKILFGGDIGFPIDRQVLSLYREPQPSNQPSNHVITPPIRINQPTPLSHQPTAQLSSCSSSSCSHSAYCIQSEPVVAAKRSIPLILPLPKLIPQAPNPNDYLIVIPRGEFLEVYSLKSSQQQILQAIWNAPVDAKEFRYVDPTILLDVTTFDGGFLAQDGDKRYFVLRTDPRIGQVVTSASNSNSHHLLDRHGQVMTHWPPAY